MRTGIALLLFVLHAPLAHAQGPLARAEQQLELAEFERAAQLLEEVAGDASARLDRDGVARLLRLRAVVRSALGRERDASRDLASLVIVLDGREPGPLPQSLRRRFDRLRRARGGDTLSVRVTIRPLGERDVRARVVTDGGDVVLRTELSCTGGGREVASSDSGSVTIRGERELRCEGRAFGPGGWEIGSSTARWRGGGGDLGDDADGLDEALLWVLGGVGAAALIGILISVAVVASASSGVAGPIWVPRE